MNTNDMITLPISLATLAALSLIAPFGIMKVFTMLAVNRAAFIGIFLFLFFLMIALAITWLLGKLFSRKNSTAFYLPRVVWMCNIYLFLCTVVLFAT